MGEADVRVASCMSTPGPSTLAWSIAWFIIMTPAPPVARQSSRRFPLLQEGAGQARFCFIRVALIDTA